MILWQDRVAQEVDSLIFVRILKIAILALAGMVHVIIKMGFASNTQDLRNSIGSNTRVNAMTLKIYVKTPLEEILMHFLEKLMRWKLPWIVKALFQDTISVIGQ